MHENKMIEFLGRFETYFQQEVVLPQAERRWRQARELDAPAPPAPPLHHGLPRRMVAWLVGAIIP